MDDIKPIVLGKHELDLLKSSKLRSLRFRPFIIGKASNSEELLVGSLKDVLQPVVLNGFWFKFRQDWYC